MHNGMQEGIAQGWACTFDLPFLCMRHNPTMQMLKDKATIKDDKAPAAAPVRVRFQWLFSASMHARLHCPTQVLRPFHAWFRAGQQQR